MSIFDRLINKIKYSSRSVNYEAFHEYCSNCQADLTMQKGFSNDFPYWICTGCGTVLMAPDMDDSSVLWRCDRCGDVLNNQEGFKDDCGQWACTKCGYSNKIASSEIYASEDEIRADLKNPYKGMSDEDVLALSFYNEIEAINGREDVILVRNMENGQLYVKKILSTYDVSIYKYLMDHPVANMPKIIEVHEGAQFLTVIEEHIAGRTVSEILEAGPLEMKAALIIAQKVCTIAASLHSLEKPIIHRDIKPSNVIVSKEGEVFLLDMNVAKWYRSGEIEDTKLLGTQYYAAPEQTGYGFSASSEKSDIYAIGMLLNVMLTGKFPKEEKASGPEWDIIEKCICLEADERFSDRELLEALDTLLE